MITILHTIDKKTGNILQVNPSFLKQGDVAIVEYVPEVDCVIETFAQFPPLGRIVIRSNPSNLAYKVTLAVGQVKEVLKQKDGNLFSLWKRTFD